MKRTASKLPHWPPRLPGSLAWFRWWMLPKVLLLLLTAGILSLLIFTHLDIYQVGSVLEQFRVGQPVPRDIVAPRDIRWDDSDKRRQLQDDAANRVPPVYVTDAGAAAAATEQLDSIFTILRAPAAPDATDQKYLANFHIDAELVNSARAMNPATLAQLQVNGASVLKQIMTDPIKQDVDEASALHHADQLVLEHDPAPEHVTVMHAVIAAVMRPTLRKDEKATEANKEQARASVEPVSRLFHKDEIILRKGDLISASDLDQLRHNQLLTPTPLTRLLPILAITFFAVVALGAYLRNYCRPIYEHNRKLLLLSFLIIAPVWASITLGDKNEYLVGLMAIPAGSMAIAGLLGTPVAIVSSLVISLTAALTADHSFNLLILTLGSALTGIMAVGAIWPAIRALPAAFALVAINLVLLLSLEGLQPGGGFSSFWSVLGNDILSAAAGGIGATIVAVGAIYTLARPFGITTYLRLMELSNPNETLLRRLMLETPGTYHSSVMVANIAEAAADAIGANALLTRVSALYHDVGKLKRPAFFVENQAPLGIEENVHQKLSPKLSYLILTSHVRDGVEIARKAKLPEEVIAIISEHHGTTLAAYFYHRALNESRSEQVSEHDFRYPGPRPRSREAAVVMLADSVQATVKALKEPTPNRIESMVQNIINNRLEDGQFEECDITLRDLRRISEILVRILTGLYTYTRLEYPDIKGEGSRLRVNLNSTTTSASSETSTLTQSG